MADGYRDSTFLSRGGLFTNEDALFLANQNPGAATRLLNFEVSQFGGYRRINGYEYYDATYPTVPGLGKVLGVWIHNDTVYAARRNSGDDTGSLGTNPFSVTEDSPTVTVTHTSHGLSVGAFVTFSNASVFAGINVNSEYVVASVVNANTYTFTHTANADSTTSGGGASVSYSYSYYYSVYRFNAGVGWGSDITTGTRSAIGVNKLRTTEHSFTGSEVHIVTDGVNRPFRHNGTTYIEIYDRQGTSDTDTEDQLSNIFDTSNGDATVNVTHVGHGLTVGDTVRFSNIDVNLGGENANNKDYTVTVIVDADNYEFELSSASTVSAQNNVGGTAINWFYTLAGTGTKNVTSAKYNTDFRNHIFFAGMSDNPNFLVFSSPNTDLNYQPATGAGVINVGFTVTGIQKFRDNLYIFGSDRIKRLVGNNSSDFILQEVTNNVGCIAADSIIEIGGDVLFLSSDGIRPIQGTARIGDIELETISKSIQQLLRTLTTTNDLNSMCSVVVRNKTQFRYFFPVTSTTNSEGLIGGLRFSGQRSWEFGQLLGIQASVAASGLINNVEVVVHGDLSGNIFKQESGNTFNGSEVIALYATPFIYFESTERRKTFHHLSIFTRPEGQSTINLGIAFDWDNPNIPIPTTYPLETADAVLRYTTTEGTYDSSFTFGGSSSPILETNLQGSGRAISLIITSTGTQAPYSISGYSITYQENGYR